MADKNHKLNEWGTACTCKTPGCKKWKEHFVEPGKEKRCPRCWTLASIYQSSEGQFTDWCFNCQLPI